MLIALTVAVPPVIELAGRDAEPSQEQPDSDPGLLRPALDKMDDLVPYLLRNPDPGQSSPSSFFKATCSAISSANTSSLI